MEKQFHSKLIENAPFGYAYHKIILDEKGNPEDYEFIEVNEEFEKLTGLKKDDILNKRVTEVLPGIRDGEFDWVALYGEVALKGGRKEFEQYSEPLKKHYHVSVHSPEKHHFITLFTDITRYVQVEKELKESEERYRSIIQNTANCVVIYRAVEEGKDFIIIDFNPMAEKVEKISKKDVLGKKVTEAFPGVESFGLLDVFRQTWKTGKPGNLPVSFYKDGRIAGYRENYVYRLSGDEIVVIYEDITERKQIEDELHSHRSHLEEMVKKQTQELSEKNKKLEETMRVFVGREIKINKLEKMVAELEAKLPDR